MAKRICIDAIQFNGITGKVTDVRMLEKFGPCTIDVTPGRPERAWESDFLGYLRERDPEQVRYEHHDRSGFKVLKTPQYGQLRVLRGGRR